MLLFILGDYPFNHVSTEYSYPGKPGTPKIDAHDTEYILLHSILTLQDAVVLRTRTPPSLGPEQGISLLHPRISQTATVLSLPCCAAHDDDDQHGWQRLDQQHIVA